jgi:hypothetical protein
MLTELGLHPDAAGRLAASCETVEDLLAADIATLAERTHVSTLMLATVREELKRASSPAESESPDILSGTPQDGSSVISLTERREHLREQPDGGSSE